MAFVLEVIAFSILFSSILKSSNLTSTKTGIAPTIDMASAVAKNVKGLVIT